MEVEYYTTHVRTHMVCEECELAEETHTKFKVCGQCKDVRYCSRECQKTNYAKHKTNCKKKAINRKLPPKRVPFNLPVPCRCFTKDEARTWDPNVCSNYDCNKSVIQPSLVVLCSSKCKKINKKYNLEIKSVELNMLKWIVW